MKDDKFSRLFFISSLDVTYGPIFGIHNFMDLLASPWEMCIVQSFSIFALQAFWALVIGYGQGKGDFLMNYKKF